MYLIPAHIILTFGYAVLLYFPVLVRSLGYSVALVGVFLAIAEGAGLLGPFLMSRLADKHGRYKLAIILSFFLMALPALPLALFVHPVLSAIFVAIIAIGSRSATPLVEAITTISVGESGDYGKIRVTGSIAFACFALFMQWVPVLRPESSWNIGIWICISSIFSMMVIALLPIKSTRAETPRETSQETSQEASQEASQEGSKDAPNRINKKSIWTPLFILGLVFIGLNRLAMAPAYSFLPLFVIEYMHWDAVGLLWALACAAEIPFLYISSRIIRRFGAMPILAFTSVMVALRLALYAIFPLKAGVIVAQLLHSFCFGLFHPAAVAFISRCVPTEQRSFGMTLYLSLGAAAPLMLGNFIGGFIVDYAGYRFLFGSFTVFALLSLAVYFAGRLKYGSAGEWK